MEPQRIALVPKLCAVPSLLPLSQQAQSRKGRGVITLGVGPVASLEDEG